MSIIQQLSIHGKPDSATSLLRSRHLLCRKRRVSPLGAWFPHPSDGCEACVRRNRGGWNGDANILISNWKPRAVDCLGGSWSIAALQLDFERRGEKELRDGVAVASAVYHEESLCLADRRQH